MNEFLIPSPGESINTSLESCSIAQKEAILCLWIMAYGVEHSLTDTLLTQGAFPPNPSGCPYTAWYAGRGVERWSGRHQCSVCPGQSGALCAPAESAPGGSKTSVFISTSQRDPALAPTARSTVLGRYRSISVS